MKRYVSIVAAVALMGAVTAGCNSVGGASAGAQTAEGVEKQIAAIQNNPNMPQQAKDAAIASLQSAKAQAEASSQRSASAADAQKAAKR